MRPSRLVQVQNCQNFLPQEDTDLNCKLIPQNDVFRGEEVGPDAAKVNLEDHPDEVFENFNGTPLQPLNRFEVGWKKTSLSDYHGLETSLDHNGGKKVSDQENRSLSVSNNDSKGSSKSCLDNSKKLEFGEAKDRALDSLIAEEINYDGHLEDQSLKKSSIQHTSQLQTKSLEL